MGGGKRAGFWNDSAINSEQVAGTHQAIFDATRMATGMYIYRLSLNGRPAITNTILLVK